MNDLFKCKNCGAPRSYINQYCPICESSGPHIPAGSRTSRSRPIKRKVNPDAPWWDDNKPDEKTIVNKRKEIREKERKKDPFKERQPSKEIDNDKEMRSLWANGPSTKPISRKTWRNISIGAFALLVLVIIAVNFGTIIDQVVTAKNQVLAWAAKPPAPVAPTASANTTEQKPSRF